MTSRRVGGKRGGSARRRRVLGATWLAVMFAVVGAIAGDTDPDPAREQRPWSERAAIYLRGRQWRDEWIVLTISTLPIVELRGAVPVAIHLLDMPWWKALPLSIVGNMIPVPLILALLGPVSRWGLRWSLSRRLLEPLFARTRRKTAHLQKYETLGLTLFVAVPLPATGAWTGAMAAFLLGIRWDHALVAIGAGVGVAGVIVTVLSLLGWLGAAVAAGLLLAPVIGTLAKMLTSPRTGGP